MRKIIAMSNILFSTEAPLGGRAPDHVQEIGYSSVQKRPCVAVRPIIAMSNILFSTEALLGGRAPDHDNKETGNE